MRPPDTAKAAAAQTANGPRESDRLAGATEDFLTSTGDSGHLIDRFGNPHSEAIFKNWSMAAIEVMGIRRLPKKPAGAA